MQPSQRFFADECVFIPLTCSVIILVFVPAAAVIVDLLENWDERIVLGVVRDDIERHAVAVEVVCSCADGRMFVRAVRRVRRVRRMSWPVILIRVHSGLSEIHELRL